MTATTAAASHGEGSRPRGRPGYSRDDVLRRAIDLFIRQGYDATSISDLAKDLGVSKSAIFHHFDGKESILAAALDEALDGLDQVVADARDAADVDAYRRLRGAVAASVQILATHLPAVTLLLRVRGNSPSEQAAMARRRAIDVQLATMVREAVAEGRLRSDVDPDTISRLIFGMVNSLVDWYHPDGAVDAATLAQVVTTVLFDGLHRSPR
ncbi:TetR/AcrR family transcriptional regulator [Mycolicibacterium obuense]|uniref:HTH-type transcriptional repressor KstR2 n=1 Tax=Mycolicibacterium obuense TaxID=1807 RepID=A0A0J6WIZ8_9MYCO|nr:TetR/AcrR family transcriptional regulator [Mycolicibacterium obuense]KMO81983.1 HTH-type transcriptional repressor KstR2 [Mycolicibacterium obuense]